MLYCIEPQYSEHFDITYFLTIPNPVRYIEVLLYVKFIDTLGLLTQEYQTIWYTDIFKIPLQRKATVMMDKSNMHLTHDRMEI